eukprot:jgi/Bigna1/131108/aug1.13_g5816
MNKKMKCRDIQVQLFQPKDLHALICAHKSSAYSGRNVGRKRRRVAVVENLAADSVSSFECKNGTLVVLEAGVTDKPPGEDGIPGSIYLNAHDLEHWPVEGERLSQGSGNLISPQRLKEIFLPLGVEHRSTVAVSFRAYQEHNQPIAACRVMWALAVIGVKNLILLDGGYLAWRRAKLPTCKFFYPKEGCKGIKTAVTAAIPVVATAAAENASYISRLSKARRPTSSSSMDLSSTNRRRAKTKGRAETGYSATDNEHIEQEEEEEEEKIRQVDDNTSMTSLAEGRAIKPLELKPQTASDHSPSGRSTSTTTSSSSVSSCGNEYSSYCPTSSSSSVVVESAGSSPLHRSPYNPPPLPPLPRPPPPPYNPHSVNASTKLVEEVVDGRRGGAVLADVRAWEEHTGVRHNYAFIKLKGRIPGSK